MKVVVIDTQCFPNDFGKHCVATPRGREWSRLLRVVALQGPLQTSPVTQLPVRYIHTAVPYVSYTLYCTVQLLHQKKQKFAPSVTADINP